MEKNEEYINLRKLGYKTHKELNQELKDRTIESIGIEDINKADQLEIALLPKGIRFPENGDIYQAKSKVEINYLTHWRAPFTGGGKSQIPEGTQIRVISESGENVSVLCIPIEESKIEKQIVSKKDRKSFDYDGFTLVIKTKTLNEDFELLANFKIKGEKSIWKKAIELFKRKLRKK